MAASTASKRIQAKVLDPGIKFDEFKLSLDSSGEAINILEAAGSLHEGLLYGLSLSQLAEGLNAKVLLAHFWQDSRSVEALLDADSATFKARRRRASSPPDAILLIGPEGRPGLVVTLKTT